MSSRIRSEFGSLGDRVASGSAKGSGASGAVGAPSVAGGPDDVFPDVVVQQVKPLEPAVPVWVRGGNGWLPGVLLRWLLVNGSWHGDVLMWQPAGGAGQWLVAAGFLRPGGEPPAA